MTESSAVRDHLANERTQLAWLRTSANVIVVGLAVARFADGGEVTAASLVAGGLLILVGAVGIGLQPPPLPQGRSRHPPWRHRDRQRQPRAHAGGRRAAGHSAGLDRRPACRRLRTFSGTLVAACNHHS